MTRCLFVSVMVWISALAIAYLSVATVIEGQKPSITSGKIIELLDSVGIPAESAIFVRRTHIGRFPQIPQDVCFYKIRWYDAEWEIGVDIVTNKIVMLSSSEAVIVPEGRCMSIERYEDAVRIADMWFQRFGVEIKKTMVWDVRREPKGNWVVERFRLIAPDTIVRVGATIELDEKTGGLVGFHMDPELLIPPNLPRPVISSKEAIAIALEQIAKRRTEHYEPSMDAQLLDCHQFITWKQKSDDQFIVHRFWRIRFYGRTKKIYRLPYEFQKLMPPEVVPVLWDVLVDSITREVDIHWVSQRNELFTNGKLYQW